MNSASHSLILLSSVWLPNLVREIKLYINEEGTQTHTNTHQIHKNQKKNQSTGNNQVHAQRSATLYTHDAVHGKTVVTD